MFKRYTRQSFAREIEYGWYIPKTLVRAVLFHKGVTILDARKIEQQELSSSYITAHMDFDNNPIPPTKCKVRTRIRKTTFMRQAPGRETFSLEGEAMYEYTTKYCLPNADRTLPVDRMELNAEISGDEYYWLTSNAVAQTEQEVVPMEHKVRYTISIDGTVFSLDVLGTVDKARLELELVHRKDATKPGVEFLPDWLRDLIEDYERENLGKIR